MDYAYKPHFKNGVIFSKIDVNEVIKLKKKWDICYSRFLLHSLSNKQIIKLIEWTKGYFMAEFRISGDVPKLFKDHKRNFIDMLWLRSLLIKNGFKILFCKKSYNYAKYKNEKPLIGRIIAHNNM